jgi:hypothetical protein
VTRQRCSLGQRVGAGSEPKVAKIVPFGLVIPVPLTTRVSPAAPASGASDESTGPFVELTGLVVAVVFGLVDAVGRVVVVLDDPRLDRDRPVRPAATCVGFFGAELESAAPMPMPAATTTAMAIRKRYERGDRALFRARAGGKGTDALASGDVGALAGAAALLSGSALSVRCRVSLISPSVSIALW